MAEIKILKLNDLNTLVIRQVGGNNLFMLSKDGIIITIPNLSYLIKYLVFGGFVSVKVLEQIVNDWHDYKKENE